jgi:membrane fusion protein (multidrug efflux system)
VEADVAQTYTITRKVKAVGTLKATDSALMKSEVPGVVAQVNFHDGAAVKKGDLLMMLDDSVPKAEYEAAVSEYHQKKSAHERYEELFKRNIVPALEREKARAEAEVSYSQMRLRAARLEQYKVIAPFDGLIGIRDVSVGSYVQQGADLITVVKLNPMKVDFKVPEAYLQDLAIGQEAVVSVDGFAKADFIAKIDAIDPKIDPASHSIQVRGSFDNLDIKVRPGIFANVILTMGQKTDALMVAESAIDRSGQDEYVYVLRDIRGEKVAIRTIVTTGLRENGRVEILDGLSLGKEVVTAGQSKIRDGFQVRVVERLVPSKPVTDPLTAAGEMLSKPAANLVTAAGHILAKPEDQAAKGDRKTAAAEDKASPPEGKAEPATSKDAAPAKSAPVNPKDVAPTAPLMPLPASGATKDSMTFPKPARPMPEQSVLVRKPTMGSR